MTFFAGSHMRLTCLPGGGEGGVAVRVADVGVDVGELAERVIVVRFGPQVVLEERGGLGVGGEGGVPVALLVLRLAEIEQNPADVLFVISILRVDFFQLRILGGRLFEVGDGLVELLLEDGDEAESRIGLREVMSRLRVGAVAGDRLQSDLQGHAQDVERARGLCPGRAARLAGKWSGAPASGRYRAGTARPATR